MGHRAKWVSRIFRELFFFFFFVLLPDARGLQKTKLLKCVNDSYCPMRKMPHRLCNQRDTVSKRSKGPIQLSIFVQHLFVCHNTDLGGVQDIKETSLPHFSTHQS